MAQFNKTLSNNSQYRLELVVNQGSPSTSNNTSNVSWTLRVRKLSGSGYWANGTFNWSVNIGGVSRSGSISGYDFRNYTLLNLGSGTVTITHNSDGKKTINVSGKWTAASSLGSATASGSLTLTTIPRYLTIRTLSASNITHNSARISWGTDRRANRVEYKIGSGSWKLGGTYDATSGSFTATGLTPNASNSLTVRTRAKDSGLWTSKSLSVRTLGPATISSMSASNIWPHKFTVNFAVNQGLSAARWRIGSGSWNSISSGARSFNVTGRSPNTSYSITLEVTSNAQTTTRTISVKTTPLATATLPNTKDTDSGWTATISKSPAAMTTEVRLRTGTGVVLAGWSDKSTSTSRTYSITDARNNLIYDAYPNTTAAKVYYEVRSYEGNTLLGTTTTSHSTHTITKPKPSIKAGAIIDIGDLSTSVTGDPNVLVATKSRIRVGYTAAKGGRGTTNRLKVTVKAGAYSASADTTTSSGDIVLGSIPNNGNVTISVEVTDSRGLKNTDTKNVRVLPYTPPTLVTFTPERENQYEQPSYLISGVNLASIRVSNEEKNKVTSLRYRVRELPGGAWGSWANSPHTSKSGGTNLQLISTNTFMSNYPNDKEYQVEMEITDSFNEKRSWTSVLPKGIAMLSFEGGGSIKAGVPIIATEGIGVPDTRDIVSVPDELPGKAVSFEFKRNTSVGNPPVTASATYSHIINVAGWSSHEGSGGWPTQISVGAEGIATRQAASATTWNPWVRVSKHGHKHSASDITSGTLSTARLPDIPTDKIQTLYRGPLPAGDTRTNTYWMNLKDGVYYLAGNIDKVLGIPSGSWGTVDKISANTSGTGSSIFEVTYTAHTRSSSSVHSRWIITGNSQGISPWRRIPVLPGTANIADYIISQGTHSHGSWEKWNSGKYEFTFYATSENDLRANGNTELIFTDPLLKDLVTGDSGTHVNATVRTGYMSMYNVTIHRAWFNGTDIRVSAKNIGPTAGFLRVKFHVIGRWK